ncbi:MAG: hypothetical protein V3V39_13980 [Desulfobacterales bacterium]
MDLLDFVIEKHGGLDRLKSVNQIIIEAKTGGWALPLRFRLNAFKDYQARIFMHTPHVIITPHPKPGKRGVFRENTVWIENDSGRILTERKNARNAFQGFRHKIWWDNLDAMHFAGYALWNYLTIPYLLLHPDLKIEEIAPWEEGGERWRRLTVIFPTTILTHSTEQTFYFDASGLLRRHDYTAEVFGPWAHAAHYSWGHREFDGITIPTQRQVFPIKKDGKPLRLVTLVRIEIIQVKVKYGDKRETAG